MLGPTFNYILVLTNSLHVSQSLNIIRAESLLCGKWQAKWTLLLEAIVPHTHASHFPVR